VFVCWCVSVIVCIVSVSECHFFRVSICWCVRMSVSVCKCVNVSVFQCFSVFVSVCQYAKVSMWLENLVFEADPYEFRFGTFSFVFSQSFSSLCNLPLEEGQSA
jgi:hypothetical protein